MPQANSRNQPHPKHISGAFVAVAVLGVLVAVLIGVLSMHMFVSQPPDNRVKVVAAENMWGSIVRQLGGEHVTVTSLIASPEADPHLYESDARDALALSRAVLVIKNGAGYDSFVDKLLDSSPRDDRTVVDVSTVLQAGSGANPHFWYALDRIHLVADAIAAALVAKDPTHQADYENNLRVFKDSLQPLLAKVDHIKNTFQGAPIAYTEPIAEYLLVACGLRNLAPQGFAVALEEGVEPSIADQQSFRKLINPPSIRLLAYNPQAESSVTQDLRRQAEEAHIPVVNFTETMPIDVNDYQTWQLKQLDALLAALDNKNE